MRGFCQYARPHPNPLPRGEGVAVYISRDLVRPRCNRQPLIDRENPHENPKVVQGVKQRRMIPPLLGERVGVRASVPHTS